MKNIRLFKEFHSPKFGEVDLGLELENKKRRDPNVDEDSFLENELGVPEDELFSTTFWTSLELSMEKYKKMSNEEFFDYYKKNTVL